MFVSWHFWIIIHISFTSLHLQLIWPTSFMERSESLLITLLLLLRQMEDTQRCGFPLQAVLSRRHPTKLSLGSCMTGCSSGHRHSVISHFTQNMAIFCLFQLFLLLLSLWNGYNILKSLHIYYISNRVSLYSQNSIIIWAVNRKALWKPASILPCLSSYLNKDCLVFTL